MRKAYKRKRRSCALCKPHKVGWDIRWKAREAARRTQMERDCRRPTPEFGRGLWIMMKELDQIVLTADLPKEGLKAGDVGMVVHIHRGGETFEVEFMTLAGETIAVTTVLASQIRPVGKREITHARELTSQ